MSEELLNTTVEQEYDASQIQVLEGLEAVRNVRACISARRPPAACTIWS